jgi:hypothetical protein
MKTEGEDGNTTSLHKHFMFMTMSVRGAERVIFCYKLKKNWSLGFVYVRYKLPNPKFDIFWSKLLSTLVFK